VFIIKKFKNKFKSKYAYLFKSINAKNIDFLNIDTNEVNDEITEYKDLSDILKSMSPYKPFKKKRPY